MGVLDARECERGLEGLYRRLRAKVLARARRWFPSLTEADLEDIYQAAWLSAIRTQSEVNDLEGYVLDAAYSQGLMELRRRRRKPADSLDAEAERPDQDRRELDKTAVITQAPGQVRRVSSRWPLPSGSWRRPRNSRRYRDCAACERWNGPATGVPAAPNARNRAAVGRPCTSRSGFVPAAVV
jgi:hypothetical protein